MTVYADLLVFLNTVIDFFMLEITRVLTKSEAALWRTVAASVLGGFCSLYIFLPQSPLLLEILIKFAVSVLLAFVCFGIGTFKKFVRVCFTLFTVGFGFAGISLAVWYGLRPKNMIINNSVVYFAVSPTVLVLSAAAFYLVSTLINRFFARRSAMAQRCELTVFDKQRFARLSGIIDTGNSLCDPFGQKAVIIVNENVVKRLLNAGEKNTRYRAIPCSAVTGEALLDGYRIEKAVAVRNGKQTVLKSPILAVSNRKIEESEALLNPQIFD